MLTARRATLSDLDLFYEWANDPVSRANSFNQEPIARDGHARWFEAKLSSPGSVLLVCESEGEPVGQIRFDFDGRAAGIDFSVAPSRRGRGYGAAVLKAGRSYVRKSLGRTEPLIGVVKDGNVPSRMAFRRAGFLDAGEIVSHGERCGRFVDVGFVVASSNPIYRAMKERLTARLGVDFPWIERKEELSMEMLSGAGAKFVFFPHWSHIIPSGIVRAVDCVIFHMTDLPYGRGGSPLQNLIVRGHRETKISALRAVDEVDAGPIYMKRDLSLEGSAGEIFERASRVIEEMMVGILTSLPEPAEQTGEPVIFARRTPEQSELPVDTSLEKLYDHIRMLDAPGYPRAFLEVGGFRLELSDAELKEGDLTAHVRVTKK